MLASAALVTVHTDDGDDYEAAIVDWSTGSYLVRPTASNFGGAMGEPCAEQAQARWVMRHEVHPWGE